MVCAVSWRVVMKRRQRKFRNESERRRRWMYEIGKMAIANKPDDVMADKVRFTHGVYDLSENGEVGVAWDETDCDMCRATGVNVMPAIPVLVYRWIDKKYEHAEGPFHWNLVTPTQAKGIEPSSRDLALEAFEDGHPHVVYP
jgi:hypothetical protein